jgi:hypothetical protein
VIDIANRPEEVLPLGLGELGIPPFETAKDIIGPKLHVKRAQLGRLFEQSHLGESQIIESAGNDHARLTHLWQP